MYDIIGDLHGHAELLKKLLLQWGYQKTPDGYAHPTNKAVLWVILLTAGRKSVKRFG
jgi:hypothetical protein